MISDVDTNVLATEPFKKVDRNSGTHSTWVAVSTCINHTATPSVLPAPRAGHTVTLCTGDGSPCALIFGGASTEDGYYNTLFSLDLTTYIWTNLLESTMSTTPLPRYEHAACMARSEKWGNSQERLVILFGGASEGPMNDIWSFDLKQRRWEQVHAQSISQHPPTARTLHTVARIRTSSAVDDHVPHDRIYIFGGGMHQDVPVEDDCMHCLDMDHMVWIVVHPGAGGHDEMVPESRLGHTLSAVGKNVIMFGGMSKWKHYDDLWVFDTEKYTWFKPNVSGQRPDGRSAHSATVMGTDIVIFGGLVNRTQLTVTDEVYILSTDTWTWRKEYPAFLPHDTPGSRIDHDACAIPVPLHTSCDPSTFTRKMCLVGGMNLDSVFNDVFELCLE
ncbi:hypothetical protein QVD99_007769 [Batrachochytrium dendrobatidis]|nr:hypothetical protein O5D80_001425 [Batrachochytrium dendrobatidis]KAK5665418.1 hypothetical protein QVD99_007769 [Batrachochytrium dendrobatidis]